jgi:hypothetical protein
MKAFTTTLLVAASALALGAPSASAAIVCNDEGDCWHVRGRADYKSEFRLRRAPRQLETGSTTGRLWAGGA